MGTSSLLLDSFGTILGGAVHDYMSGMISIKHNGASISEITGMYLGDSMKSVMRVFSVVLLVLVGTVFSTGPAKLLSMLTGMNATTWLIIISLLFPRPLITYRSINRKTISNIWNLFDSNVYRCWAGIVFNGNYVLPRNGFI